MLNEHRFSCPYCGESITMVLDFSIAQQAYIEDCEVCCRPIEIGYSVDQSVMTSFHADTADE